MQRQVFHSIVQRVALAALFGFVASSVLATGASPLEGTWGGADAQGGTAQITIVGNQRSANNSALIVFEMRASPSAMI